MSGAAAYKGLQAPADYVGQAMAQNRRLDETRRANKRADALAKEHLTQQVLLFLLPL